MIKLSYTFQIEANQAFELLLPFGIKKMRIRPGQTSNTNFYRTVLTADTNDFEFPIIDGKSPNYLYFAPNKDVRTVALLIEEIGGVPDSSYFGDEITQEKIDELRAAYNELISGDKN